MRKTVTPIRLLLFGLALAASLAGAELPSTAKGQPALPAAVKPGTDAGSQDPADFFRPPGLVRKSYSQSAGALRNEEVATYHANAGLDETVAQYREGLPTAGWKEISDSDSGSGANRLRMIEWHTPAKEAEIRFYGAKSGADLRVRIFTYKSATPAKAASADLSGAALMIVMPDVVNRGTRQAEIMLGDLKLKVQYGPPRIDPVPSRYEKGTVAAQSPAAGQIVPKDSTVTLTPWLGSVVVPDVVEKARRDAESILHEKWLKVAFGPPKIDPVPSRYEKGTVAAQNPAAGQIVPKDSTVTLTPWLGSFVVPNLVGQPIGQAESILAERGTRNVVWATPRLSANRKQIGTVAGQSPAAGATVPKDSTVTLTAFQGRIE